MPSKKFVKPVRVVLDTNNLISSQINKKGASFKIFNLFKKGEIVIYTSSFQLHEFEQVLNYPRISKKYNLTPKKIKKIISVMRNYTQVVYPVRIPEIIKDDLDDNQILAIALEGMASCIVSGDQHLLHLGKFKDIPIISAKEFLRMMRC